ncbi:hypothetical protein DSO57_1032777 [Entomophthora muscae]|uniref:Uncharacterized protein n=1 Tax=Entomophthora muscae TaxID=34485 RepID=A0ACC2UAN4_9FUNG|nr:hypothetical protein DSO57_1032777 [Entomophthora muscae]
MALMARFMTETIYLQRLSLIYLLTKNLKLRQQITLILVLYCLGELLKNLRFTLELTAFEFGKFTDFTILIQEGGP